MNGLKCLLFSLFYRRTTLFPFPRENSSSERTQPALHLVGYYLPEQDKEVDQEEEGKKNVDGCHDEEDSPG